MIFSCPYLMSSQSVICKGGYYFLPEYGKVSSYGANGNHLLLWVEAQIAYVLLQMWSMSNQDDILIIKPES